MEFNSAKTFYFSGIGGIGMSGLAQLLAEDGKIVIGSDISSSPLLDSLKKKSITITTLQDGSLINSGVDMAVFSAAVPSNHPERQKAQQMGIPAMSYFEAVGHYMKDFEYGITISGTHGKSTTAAMIANILIDAGLDPTVIIGSIASEFNSNARHGGRKFFVVEACEHFAHMLKLHPRLIVLTNIEEDHLDYYRDLEHIVMTFQKYINGLPVNGVLVKNSDDSESKELGFDGQIITYGIDQIADQQATNIRYDHLQQYFCSGGVDFHLNIPGKFNVYNALAAITVARHLHIAEEVIQKTLANFRGVWRRFQILGEYRGATVISDYAHHPTAVRSTISAAKDFYPKRRLITVFQPHQHSRTKKLFKKFVESFAAADFVILQEIFDVVGREAENDQNISSRDLVKVIEQRGKYAFFANSPVETRRAIDELLEPNDVLLIMGAGDIYQLAENLFNGNV